jgi:hypothetical protein
MPPVDLSGASPEVRQVIWEIRALVERINYQKWPFSDEWQVRIDGMVDIAIRADGLALVRPMLLKATTELQAIWLSRSRRRYATGVLMGLGGGLLLTVAAWFIGRWLPTQITSPEEIFALVFFTSAGSFASVMGRLGTIDIGEASDRALLTFSAIGRPVVALAFASVVFVIFKNRVITSAGCTKETEDMCRAILWVAEFLTGYSERFAPDLLARATSLVGGVDNTPKE